MKINFGCPLPYQDACASRSTGRRFTHASPARSRQHLQKHFAEIATCRATDALPVKPSFLAQLGMCQPAFVWCAPCGSTRAFIHQPARRSYAPCPSKTACANMPFPCSLSTIQNASPLFFLQTNPNNSVSGTACRPASPPANSTLLFRRHRHRGAQPRPLHARLGALPPRCLGRFAPFTLPQQPLGLLPASLPDALASTLRKLGFSQPHGLSLLPPPAKPLTSAPDDFSLAQAVALRKHLLPARWRQNQKPLG